MYHTRRTILLVPIFIAFLFFSCQGKKDEIVIILNPYQLVLGNINPHDVVSIVIDCKSPDELKHLLVTSRVEGNFSNKELDTLISGSRFYYRYEYIVPEVLESTRILLEFTLTDSRGEVATNMKVLDVITTAKYLKETAGHEMFSGHSGKQNAYNIIDGAPLYSRIADTLNMHLADTSKSDVLLNRWISPAGVKFVKFNGFDYANCTNVSIQNSFESGIKTEFIENMNIGDIYLVRVKNSSTSYVAIKIVNIVDAPGNEWDRYVFNLKK